LASSTAAAAVVASHATVALSEPPSEPSAAERNAPPATPRILGLELFSSAPLAELEEFYHGLLGLAVLSRTRHRLTLRAGQSRLTFKPAAVADEWPFYHFAFNIPENKVVSALDWQKQRSPLLHIPERLRDPAYPNEVVDYSHWNAHSIFFLDPAGNVVEYIARHDLANAAEGPFTSEDILYASEIGLIVDDVRSVASKLNKTFAYEQYRGGDEQFTAMGDEYGLLLVMRRGRILNFNRESQEKAARVHGTRVTIRGARPASLSVEGYPYALSAEA
jgi:catechol-2,3-dioxygenase